VSKEEVRRDDAGGVITVTFTRDDKLNAVTPGMLSALREAAADLADDDAQRVLVITGEGRYFTSGLDIRSMRGDLGKGTDGLVRGSTMRRQYRGDAMHDFYDDLESIEKPIVLAAQATCLGIGVELGASCDFRLSAQGARFGLPEVANLSVLPGSGGISRLTRLIGPHWTKWIAMAGQSVDAEQALSIGLVHAVYPAETFAEQVQEFAKHLASQPREAMGLAKLAVDTAVTADRRTARDFDRLAQTLLFQSPEFAAQQAAFASNGKKR
jgi:enoyl-CoA hydratase/carnithine racemase